MKKKLRNGFLVCVAVLITGYLLITGVLDLASEKNRVTVDLMLGEEYMDIEHSVAGIIPLYTDHYFLGYADTEGDDLEVYIFRGGKHWAEKTFDSAEEGNVTVTALKKRLDYEVSTEVAANLSAVDDGVVLPLGAEYCLDVNYRLAAVMKLVSGGLFLIAALVKLIGKKGSKSAVVTFLPFVLFLLGLAVAVYGIR